MIKEEIAKRALPAVLKDGVTRENFAAYQDELRALFADQCFGVTPDAPKEVKSEITFTREDEYCSKSLRQDVKLSFAMEKGEFTFPMTLEIPYSSRPVPAVVYISFADFRADGYQPVEEIVDAGYAYATFNYQAVTTDDNDFTNGIAALTTRGTDHDWGKIGMWAFAASRVLDYLLTRPEIDGKRIIVMGHSRLGKTALWAAAQDKRFAASVSNDSGCSGAAVNRSKVGEHIRQIYTTFPYWFCKNYEKYMDNEDKLAFEQYHLLALTCPRPVYVASGSEDEWADPLSEFISACKVGEAYQLFGFEGLGECEMPAPGGRVVGDKVGYHNRPGTHFLSRYDWIRVLRFMDIALL